MLGGVLGRKFRSLYTHTWKLAKIKPVNVTEYPTSTDDLRSESISCGLGPKSPLLVLHLSVFCSGDINFSFIY